ncbi:MAG: hypothetical protein J07HR59_00590 [Halorubrum sp. J07HR59]|nr:MAG: hypothetical protein J07HR59_00590 [Halorubrum sp. J07HR59]
MRISTSDRDTASETDSTRFDKTRQELAVARLTPEAVSRDSNESSGSGLDTFGPSTVQTVIQVIVHLLSKLGQVSCQLHVQPAR